MIAFHLGQVYKNYKAIMISQYTLEIAVYEPLFRGSERFADFCNATLGRKKIRVPKLQEW